MALSTTALALALVSCAPYISPATFARYVAVESHGNPFALHDNATDTEYEPQTRAQALAIYDGLKRDEERRCAIAKARHRYCLIDVGLVQVDESNFQKYNVTADDLLDEKENIHVAGQILLNSWQTVLEETRHPAVWRRIVAKYEPLCGPTTQVLLCATAAIYNANSIFGSPAYVQKIVDAGRDPYVVRTLEAATTLQDQRLSCGGGES